MLVTPDTYVCIANLLPIVDIFKWRNAKRDLQACLLLLYHIFDWWFVFYWLQICSWTLACRSPSLSLPYPYDQEAYYYWKHITFLAPVFLSTDPYSFYTYRLAKKFDGWPKQRCERCLPRAFFTLRQKKGQWKWKWWVTR